MVDEETKGGKWFLVSGCSRILEAAPKMPNHGLFEEAEKVKVKLLVAFDQLARRGEITEEQFEKVSALIDSLDRIGPGDLEGTLTEIFRDQPIRKTTP
ncbi:MAG: hypothetical protein HYY08_01625 [Firmicutes bacterium]|nr:hypothetical protein [Bacillota bacterium]